MRSHAAHGSSSPKTRSLRRVSTRRSWRSCRRGSGHERRLDGAHQRAEAPALPAPGAGMSQPRRIMPLPLGGEHGLPYSRGLMARALMAVGVAPDRAYALARRVGDDLAARSSDVVEVDRLESLAIESLGEVEGREALRQLRRHQELRELDLPIVILIGGATGTGKSTVATEIAYRLGITRVTSTDFIRQTMRAFFSHEFMPSIHYSSFESGLAVTVADDPLVAGFLEQSRQVLVGARASLDRALQEGWSMVLEGVHLVPGLLPSALEETLVTACVLKIDDETAHAQHFLTRDAGPDRPMA